MFADPSSWRTYQPPRVSCSTSAWLNVYVWSGKCPQKMIEYAHTLRTMFAVKFAASVASKLRRAADPRRSGDPDPDRDRPGEKDLDPGRRAGDPDPRRPDVTAATAADSSGNAM